MQKIIASLICILTFGVNAAVIDPRIKKQDEVLRLLALEGHSQAQDRYLNRLIERYMQHPISNKAELRFFLELATVRGKASATYRLGYLYLSSDELSNEFAIQLIARAAFLGHKKAIADYRLMYGLLDLDKQAYVTAFNTAYQTLNSRTPLMCKNWLVDCEKLIHKVDFNDNPFFNHFNFSRANSLSDIHNLFYQHQKNQLFKFANTKSRFDKIVKEVNQQKLASPEFNKIEATTYEEKSKQNKKQEFERISEKFSEIEINNFFAKDNEQLEKLLAKVNRYREPTQQITLAELKKLMSQGAK